MNEKSIGTFQRGGVVFRLSHVHTPTSFWICDTSISVIPPPFVRIRCLVVFGRSRIGICECNAAHGCVLVESLVQVQFPSIRFMSVMSRQISPPPWASNSLREIEVRPAISASTMGLVIIRKYAGKPASGSGSRSTTCRYEFFFRSINGV